MNFFDNKENVHIVDAFIRGVIALILFGIGFEENSYLLMAFSSFLLFTSMSRSCIIYHLFGVNKAILKLNYYLNFLPQYNPSPVFIFTSSGGIGFQNKISKKLLPEIKQINHFGNHNYTDQSCIEYKKGDLTYQINIKYISKIDAFFLYATDISKISELKNDIIKTQIEIIDLMGTIGETRSKETGNHVKRVAKYSELLALKLGFTKQEAELLRIASPMHDIGKVGIPDAILNKPGKLTAKEFTIMKTHSKLGYNLLKNSQREILQIAAIVAHEHHEKYDGNGYPRGLKGKAIHIYGRITAIADVFDALGSERCYKKAWALEKILDLLKEESGKSFDPEIIDIFLDNLDEFLVLRDRYQDIKIGESKIKKLLENKKETVS